MSRRVRFVHRLISVVVTVLMVGACVLAALMVLPTLLGYERYVIVSGSMEPTLSVGTIVYDEVVPVDEISVGDIITFVPPPEYGIDDPVTHRVVRVGTVNVGQADEERVFRTKGDANDAMDPWHMVLDGPDQGRVAHQLPHFGYFYMALQVRWVQVLVIVVPAIALVAYVLITMWRVSGEAIKEERAQAQAAPTGERGEQGEQGERDGVTT